MGPDRGFAGRAWLPGRRGAGSSVTFEWQGRKASFHRPHPGKAALRYRVRAVREFLQHKGVKP